MRKSALIIVCLWLFLICGFVLTQEITLRTGKEVLLKTVPVDPRDLLRGDYVILNYEIAQLPHESSFGYNETVYVILDTGSDNIAHVKSITDIKPSGEMYIKGKVDGCNTTIPLFKNGKCINFGIESYFVKEGTGKKLEKDLRNGTLVRVVIDKNGRSKIRGFEK